MGEISVSQLCQGYFHFQLVEYIIKIIIFLYGRLVIVREGYTSMMMMMITKEMKEGKRENEEWRAKNL
jgi:hypothetical protein